MTFKMFYTGLSGLNVAQTALMTTGHNTANVSTPGYSRQSAQVSSAGGDSIPGAGFIGNGAKMTDITRSYDRFLTTQLNQAQSFNESLTTEYGQISQIDNLLASQTSGLAPLMQSLFASVQGVANTPADPAARQQLIGSAQAMANQLRATADYLSGLNTNANNQISGSIDLINTYSEQIAGLNKQIALASGAEGGQLPNDLLDRRDQLVSDLSKLVGTKVVHQNGGQYSVFIGNGQTLVLGDRSSKLKSVVSSSDPTQNAVALAGVGGLVVEQQDSVLAGGSLGGLLQFRNETLRNTQNSLGRIAIALADTFNAQQRLGVDLNGALGQNFFTQADPSVIASAGNKGNLVLTPTFSDTGKLTTSDYKMSVEADGSYTLTRLSDKQSIALSTGFPSSPSTATFDGLTLTFATGSASVGDSFLIQPTRTGARDFDVVLIDPSKVAASAPIVVGHPIQNRGSGVITGGEVDANYLATPLGGTMTLTYDSVNNKFTGFTDGSSVAYSAGAKLSYNGINFSINGTPADGDTFTIKKNAGGVSDGRNALQLAALQNKKTIGDNSANFNDAYAQLVSTVGNKTRQVQISNMAQTSLTAQIRVSQQSVSGVNQDEETANLLIYQQMYQANAKVIQTASTMFDAILAIR